MHQVVTERPALRSLGAGLLVCLALTAAFWSCGKTDDPAVGKLDAGSPDVDAKLPEDVVQEVNSGHDVQEADAPETDSASSELAWISDADAWKEIPGTEDAVDLVLREAYPDKIGFPSLEWEGCGEGCEMADLGQGYSEWGYLPSTSTEVLNGEVAAYLQQTNTVTLDERIHSIRRVVRLDDGVTVSAIRCSHATGLEWAVCFIGRFHESALMLGASYNNHIEPTRSLRGAVVPNGSTVWALPVPLADDWPNAVREFDLEEGRSVFIVGLGAVRLMEDPTSSSLTMLEQPSTAYTGVGQGDLAIWTDYNESQSSPPRIRGWTKSGGIRTIIDGLPEETTEVAASPSHLVGIMGQKQVAMITARLWKTPRAYESGDVHLTISPSLPYTPWYGPIRTWGDYAVLPVRGFVDSGATPTGEEMVLIVQLSTWKVWRLEAPAGYSIHQDTVTLTSNHLFVGHRMEGVSEERRLRRMLRFGLDKIDSWATSL